MNACVLRLMGKFLKEKMMNHLIFKIAAMMAAGGSTIRSNSLKTAIFNYFCSKIIRVDVLISIAGEFS